jgi:hypothetical protein
VIYALGTIFLRCRRLGAGLNLPLDIGYAAGILAAIRLPRPALPLGRRILPPNTH